MLKRCLAFLIALQCIVKGQDQFLQCSLDKKFKEIHFRCKNFVENECQTLRTLTELPISDGDLENLAWLTIGDACISEIEVGVFSGGNHIVYLNLSSNLLQELDLRVFEDLPLLDNLRLDRNRLKRFSGEFPKLNLTKLDLSFNFIKSFSLTLFENLERLESLDIRNNQLSTIDWQVFINTKQLKDVHLSANPFICDCQLKALLDFFEVREVVWVRPHWKPFGDDYIPACNASKNANLVGVDLHEVEREVLTCPPEVTSVTVIIALIVVGFAVVVLFFAGYYWRKSRRILKQRSSVSGAATTVNFGTDVDEINAGFL